jgi:hypothetical protein
MLRTRRSMIVPFLIGFAVLMVLFTRLFGPFIVVPGLLCVLCTITVSMPDFIDRPWFPIGLALAAFGAPFVLEAAGVLGA